MQTYWLISAATPEDLATAVNAELVRGNSLVGGPFFGGLLFYQAVIGQRS